MQSLSGNVLTRLGVNYLIIIIANAHLLDGNAPDLVKECDSFEKRIQDAGGVDLFIGGTCMVDIAYTYSVCTHYVVAISTYVVYVCSTVSCNCKCM